MANRWRSASSPRDLWRWMCDDDRCYRKSPTGKRMPSRNLKQCRFVCVVNMRISMVGAASNVPGRQCESDDQYGSVAEIDNAGSSRLSANGRPRPAARVDAEHRQSRCTTRDLREHRWSEGESTWRFRRRCCWTSCTSARKPEPSEQVETSGALGMPLRESKTGWSGWFLGSPKVER